ncbi:MAG: M14 metallopeptidase family protein [Gemmataceae bacterium]
MTALRRSVLLCLAFAAVARGQSPIRPVTPPKAYLGFAVGDDYCLANYKQLTGYWSKIAQESDRIKLFTIGTTEEGRSQLMAVVSSPANLRRLDRYREISRRLGRGEVADPEDAKKLAADGKAVVWIDAGLHASEVLCAQMMIETVYQLLTGTDPETLRILDDVIILFVHANPDGHDLVADWYMREADPKKRSLNGLPRLYQKYIGHDNNRDFYAVTQAETKNISRAMYFDWLPQIVYNHHQAGPPGTVLFCPPFRDPFNYNIDPLIVSGIDAVGAAMMQRFLVENKPGATVRSGTRYSTWWNGGLRTTCYFHNMIGLLTETIGNPTPMTIPFRPQLQLPRADYLAPIAPQTWHLRQSVDYSVTANKAVLDYAARHREQLLSNIWLMGKNAIDRGNRDSWTVTPKMVEAARAARPNTGPGRGAQEYARLFRDPTKRDPRGYILPADQPDFLTATKFVNTLLETSVTVHRATANFTAAGKSYPAGSYVFKCAQPFRAHVLDMFEPQDHPNDFAYPDGPPTPPYDIAGWTLAYQMAVQFDRILDDFDGPFEELKGPVSPRPGKITTVAATTGYFLDARINDSFRAVNRLLKAGEDVRRLREPFADQPVGTFFVAAKPTTETLAERIATEIGIPFTGTSTPPGKEATSLKPVRVALWDRYGGSMPSGWTRWILERFEFPFQVVYAPELDKGGLREKYDVLILVDGAIPGRGQGAIRGEGFGGDQPPPDPEGNEGNIPEEYRGRRGGITSKTTGPQLKAFLEAGGTILTIGTSTALAQQLGLPVGNHLTTKDKDGKEVSLGRDKFYVPGSVLRARVDRSHPLTWGLGDEIDVMFSASPTFRLPTDGPVKRVAWYEGKTPLRSGWAWGQEHLDGGTAIAEAAVGKGRLVLFGPQVLFRAQPHGTFKLVFNGIVGAGE